MRTSLTLLMTLGLAGCGASSSKTTSSLQNFSIPFAARSDGADLSCDTVLTNLGTDRATGRIKDFRFYVSQLRFLGSDGSEHPATFDLSPWQSADLALLDFQDKDDNCDGASKTIHTTITGTLAGDVEVSGIAFSIGVPPEVNHVDLASAAGLLSVASMYWSWQSGYKFMRLDLAPEGGIARDSDPDFAATTSLFHLGSTGCVGHPEAGESVSCDRSNRPQVSLEGFRLGSSRVVLDYAALVRDLALGTDAAEAPGCMSGTEDPECAALFQRLGLDLGTGQVSATAVQDVFTLE